MFIFIFIFSFLILILKLMNNQAIKIFNFSKREFYVERKSTSMKEKDISMIGGIKWERVDPTIRENVIHTSKNKE